MIKGFVLFAIGALGLVVYLSSLQMGHGHILLVILSLAVMVIGLDLALAKFYLGKPQETIKPGEYLVVSITDVSKDGQVYCHMTLRQNEEDKFYSLPKNMINHKAQFDPYKLIITKRAGLTTAILL